ncbi:MAG: glycosyltransferase family 4 protein [Pseudomonadales bacterium]|nr:glycosyltransferase family 4 protein [Pseudomonadales bacterium]
MQLCFLIYSWFPHGGQQRDFLKLVEEAVHRGHQVTVFTLAWKGEKPQHVEVVQLPLKAMTRLRLYRKFTEQVQYQLARRQLDAVIGFNKMPGLDVYFAADPCFAYKAEKQRGFYYRFMPRYRHFIRYERAVFGEQQDTRILLLSPLQRQQFLSYYPACEPRLVDLPPGISLARRPPANAAAVRAQRREQLGLGEADRLVVQVGSGFVVKGVDRSLRALASLPVSLRDRCHYLIIGDDKPGRFQRLAKRLGIAGQCQFLGGRDDVLDYLLAADLLLHPAYSESAGYVLLEAIIAGLPVLTTDTCGYAFHVLQADAGQVCVSPFKQQDLNERLAQMLLSEQRSQWSHNGLRYGEQKDLYAMQEHALNEIEAFVHARGKRRQVDVVSA